jgi:transcriptional regulator with XRE-family HTH domain
VSDNAPPAHSLIGPSDGSPEHDDARFARNMLARREERRISQADLVKMLRRIGWPKAHQTTISRIEQGERPVRLGEARLIAAALGVDLTHLLLTPDDSKLAVELADARQYLESVRQAIKNWTVEHFRAQRQLHDAFSRGVDAGLRPTEVPTPANTFTPSGSTEDELGMAEHYLRVRPEDAVEWGRWQYKYEQSTGREPDSLPIDAI